MIVDIVAEKAETQMTMAATTKSPFRELMALQDRMNRMFDSSVPGEGTDEEMEAAGWTPAVDIYETTDAIMVNVEAPGMSRDQFTVEVKDDVLTLKGEKRTVNKEESDNYHCVERSCGSFSRSVLLPSEVDSDHAEASMQNGVLTLRLPTARGSGAKTIAIKS